MPTIVRFIHMPVEPEVVIRIRAGQKGAQHQNTSGREGHGMPVRIFVTQGTSADCTQADCRLIERINADYLLADRGYDSNAIIEQTEKQAMEIVIPPKRNHKMQRFYDKELIN
ncbi:transposase [Betaproteobacteria bacterium PRO5]|nr:transposase [Betaproteobacteria bacterium PRO5]